MVTFEPLEQGWYTTPRPGRGVWHYYWIDSRRGGFRTYCQTNPTMPTTPLWESIPEHTWRLPCSRCLTGDLRARF